MTKQIAMLAGAALLTASLAPASTMALTRNGKRCHEIDADFTSQLTTQECSSPLGLCASGKVLHDVLLKGPMFVSINDAAPSAGMPSSEPPNVLSVSGERKLMPLRGGTVSLHVVGIGIFDATGTALQMYDELNLVTSGTGRFAGAQGTLHVAGRATSATTFAGEMTGRICIP